MKKEIQVALVWAGIMLSTALAAKFAHAHGYIDADTKLRVVAMNGLWLAYYGNRIPKAIAPNVCGKRLQRFAGWALVLSGLVYAGLWAFAPIRLATTVGTGAVAAGILLTLGYGIRLRARERAGLTS